MTSKLLIDERPLTVLPSLVMLVGIERAIILQQIHWLINSRNNGVEHDGNKWIWGSYEEWCREYFPFWRSESLRKHMVKLEGQGYIISAQIKGFDRTKHYRIDYAKLTENSAAMREPNTASKRKIFRIEAEESASSMREPITASNRERDTASMREPITASNRERDTACYIQRLPETTTETTTEKRAVGSDEPTPPASEWQAWLDALCWVSYGHTDPAQLTDKQRGALHAEAAHIRDAGYTLADLHTWFADQWRSDWRWQKGKQRPRPDEVRTLIPSVRTARNGYLVTDESPPVAQAPPFAPPPKAADALPPTGDPWQSVLYDLHQMSSLAADVPLLAGSRLELIGVQDDVQLYQVVLAQPEVDPYTTRRLVRPLCRQLGQALNQKVLVTFTGQETPHESITT